MASSDEEGEIVPDCVTNYHFENDKNQPVPFSILPLLWSDDEIKGDPETRVYLHGTSDGGLRTIYKRIMAWRIELSYVHPEISVLSNEKRWIILQSPKKSYESIIRTVLVIIHWLHSVKRIPGASTISLWDYMRKALSAFDLQPSKNDILNHVPLISDAAKRDKDLANSKYLITFIEKPWLNEAIHEEVPTLRKSKFIVDVEEENDENDDGEEFDEDKGLNNELYDTVCAICDNGGEILCCEGRCMRSFHATEDAGIESFCTSLGYSTSQVKAIPNYLCENCKHQQHQCFACGKLGSSDVSSGAEVFPCISATCGHFYHPECVVKLLHPGDGTKAEEQRKKITAGESFTCPVHKCFRCKQGENKNVYDLQFAMCRRCPKAYHRSCLPREITFNCDYDNNIPQRAWDGLLTNRILIYCMDHKIVRELGTPHRNQLIFPCAEGKQKKHTSNMLSGNEKAVASKQSMVSLSFTAKRTALQLPKHQVKEFGGIQSGDSSKLMQRKCIGKDIYLSKKSNMTDEARKSLKDGNKAVFCRSSIEVEKKMSLMSSFPINNKQQKLATRKSEKTILEKPVVKKFKSSTPLSDFDSKKRVLALIKESTAAFNEEEFMKSRKASAIGAYTLGYQVPLDKIITHGKVEGSVQAIRTALKRLDEGCSIEDAKAVCEPEILYQIFNWQRKLKVYLAPFLHGTRYTSFGRHFTKTDKLKEIVDFCCGSNDFSCLMKAKLDQIGKCCSFKNYDLFQAKNDFSFEQRNWMSVNVEELPNGSQLIMGLNPPFGIKGSLANIFINKALEFKPKLLILIVPKETKRLDNMKGGYDLVWEDDAILSGKSFYLPGSVDTHHKQLEDWNLKPPPLYLWSRPDWTAMHMAIAQEHGHISKEQQQAHVGKHYFNNYLMAENHARHMAIAQEHGHISMEQQHAHAGKDPC
ncbi:Protein ENHANCED DOWNY MILDEW 2 [Quillaja saponaria]|uniref:Protein ENHANCED DOWNY MILDEW 2 n=1 Tax=Quillaja saponaria TaxID=32244 RepID=A0AAD7PMN1_QUISA|nr:Protein ENHANCED DOWNY MILDEW 2 [Quillaja saponaria]